MSEDMWEGFVLGTTDFLMFDFMDYNDDFVLFLSQLGVDVIKFIEEKKLTTGHAKILVGLDNATYVANKIIQKNFSVRQAENLVRVFKMKKRSPKTKKDPNLEALELSVTEKIGLKVY